MINNKSRGNVAVLKTACHIPVKCSDKHGYFENFDENWHDGRF